MKYWKHFNLQSFIILTIGISASLSCQESLSNELTIVIKEFCLDELKKEMIDSGKEFKHEIGEFTCNCFINKIQTGDSLMLARKTCKDEVSKTFNL